VRCELAASRKCPRESFVVKNYCQGIFYEDGWLCGEKLNYLLKSTCCYATALFGLIDGDGSAIVGWITTDLSFLDYRCFVQTLYAVAMTDKRAPLEFYQSS
jgi:hypothetical protein